MPQKKSADILRTFIRYASLLVLVSLVHYLPLFYELFLKLTIYPVNFLLRMFFDSSIVYSKLIINSSIIELIPACIGVSAYMLLLILNMTTQMAAMKRVYSLLASFAALLAFNILRIFLLSVLFLQQYPYFEQVHAVLWYFLSIILVVGIWFATAYIFKITRIPVYSDFKLLIKEINKQR